MNKTTPSVKDHYLYRATNITVSFLKAYAPTSKVAKISGIAFDGLSISLDIRQASIEGKLSRLMPSVVITGVCKVAEFCVPKLSLLKNGCDLVIQIGGLGYHVYKGEWGKTKGDVASITETGVTIVLTSMKSSPQIVVISMIFRVSVALLKSYQECFDKKRTYDAIGYLFIAMAHGINAKPAVEEIFKDKMEKWYPTKMPVNSIEQTSLTEGAPQSKSKPDQPTIIKKLSGSTPKKTLKSLDPAITQNVPVQNEEKSTEPKKRATKEDIEKILNEIPQQRTSEDKHLNSNPVINLREVLEKKGFSSEIKKVDFAFLNLTDLSFENLIFKKCSFIHSTLDRVQFENVSFNRCKFSNAKILSSSFLKCTFIKPDMNGSIIMASKFEDCIFEKGSFIYSVIKQSQFINSRLLGAVFYQAGLADCAFNGCDLYQSCFNDSILGWSQFIQCKLKETNFFKVTSKQICLNDCDLTDTLLLNTKNQFQILGGTPHQMTRPVIALAWNFKDRGDYAKMMCKVLEESQMIVLKFDYHPDQVDAKRLDAEVKTLIQQISEEKMPSTILSIPDEVLKRANKESEIEKLKMIAEEIMQYSQGLLLPGGDDLQPEFYQQERAEDTDCDPDYVRSMIEFSLVQLAHMTKKPLMGVCRASQLVNVYFGGTLIQDIEKRDVLPLLKRPDGLDPRMIKDLPKHILKEGTVGLSLHHQACDRIGQGLQVILHHEGIPKALISQDGNILLTQFHPESYVDVEKIEKEEIEDILTNERLKTFFQTMVNSVKADPKDFTKQEAKQIFNANIHTLVDKTLEEYWKKIIPIISYYSEENNQKSRAFYQAFISKVKQRFEAERNEANK